MSSGVLDGISIRGDEYFTLEKDAEIIAQHIIKPMRVWLPFNDKGGAFEMVLPKHGHEIVCTEGDFFKTDPPSGVEAVISNPPFSKKHDVVRRLNELGLKFAIIVPFLWLDGGVPFDYAHQIMMFRKRLHFIMDGEELKSPRTNCAVISNGILSNDFVIIR